MSPEQRKEASELLLHKRGIRLNLQLHVIESDDEVSLRSDQALAQRIIALSLVSSAGQTRSVVAARAYVEQHRLSPYLSHDERAFLLGDASNTRNDNDYARFAARQESLYFLAWCAGLVEKLVIPTKASQLKFITTPLPTGELPIQPGAVLAAIEARRKAVIMDWCDLLYRLHWAVRHAHLTGRAAPASLNVVAVREWHQAVNWLCRYEDEDNWDQVSTETGS